MRKAACIVLLSVCLNLTAPLRSDAIAPLAVYAAAALGATVMTMGATHFALSNQNTSYGFDGHSLVRPIIAYNQVVMAGASCALGKASNAVLDMGKAIQQGALSAYSALQEFYDNFMIARNTPSYPKQNDIVAFNDKKYILGAPYDSNAYVLEPPYTDSYTQVSTNLWYWSSTLFFYIDHSRHHPNNANSFMKVYVPYTETDNPVNYPPPYLDPNLQPSEIPGFNSDLHNAIPNNPNIPDQLDQLMKNHPDLWTFPDALPENPNSIEDYPPAQPITANDINAYTQGLTNDANQNLIDTLRALAAANPNDANIAAELAKALADAAKDAAEEVQEQTPEETFTAISDSPFGQAYNPGEFDISSRFTSFLNNVKSSGLFSFSSSFFNSLPGGGSPVFEIDGGETFGTHTIDLSETMTPGLAVAKAVLLALFGFLSIRAIIMKR